MKFGVIPATGIGDSLLLQIGARHLASLGHEATTFASALVDLREWFPSGKFQPTLALEGLEEALDPFDAILLQHDNSPRAHAIASLGKPVYTLFGAHVATKHGPLREGRDYVFERTLPMAENIKRGMDRLFPGVAPSTDNGLLPPHHLLRGRFPKRVALHPLSASPAKNWRRERFIGLRSALETQGWEPVWIVPPGEERAWEGSVALRTLSDLAAFLYESAALVGNDSGPGHLASNLGLPTLIVGPGPKQLALWRPGWRKGGICTPPGWIERFHWSRKRWPFFLPVSHVAQEFKRIFMER